MGRGVNGLVLAFSLSACATTGRVYTADRTAAEYVPLKIGQRWTYEMTYPGQIGEMTVALVGEKDGYILDDHKGAWRVTPDGLRDRDRFLIRQPLLAGNEWKSIISPSAVEHAKIESVGQPCAAVAGAFQDCLVVHGWIRRDKDMTLHIRWTWAKGIGLIKVETEAEVKGQGRIPQTRQSLKNYVLDGRKPTT